MLPRTITNIYVDNSEDNRNNLKEITKSDSHSTKTIDDNISIQSQVIIKHTHQDIRDQLPKPSTKPLPGLHVDIPNEEPTLDDSTTKRETNINIPNIINHGEQTKKSVYKKTKQFRANSFLWLKQDKSLKESSIFYQLLPVLVVNLGSLSFGLASGYSSILLPQIGYQGVWKDVVDIGEANVTSTKYQPFIMSQLQVDWIDWMLVAGGVAGGLISSVLGTYIGRRGALIVFSLVDILGWVMVAVAQNLSLILGGRFLCGLASVGYLSNTQIYVAEISQAKHRGWLAGLTFPIYSLGVLTMHVLGTMLPWHYVAASSTLGPCLLFISLILLWDSPYWYVVSGQMKLAHESLEQFRTTDVNLIAEIFQIEDYIKHNEEITGSRNILRQIKEVFTNKKYYGPFFVLNFLLITSIVSLIGLQTHVTSHIDDMNLLLSKMIPNIIQLIGSSIFVILASHLSRKMIFSVSSLLVAISLVIFGLTNYLMLDDWLSMISISMILLSSSTGLIAIPVIYTAELFPSEVRSLMSGMTFTVSSLTILGIVIYMHPLLTQIMSVYNVVWLQACVCIIGIFFCLTTIPETRNKELNQVPDKFAKWRKVSRASPWVTPQPSPSLNSMRKGLVKSNLFTQ